MKWLRAPIFFAVAGFLLAGHFGAFVGLLLWSVTLNVILGICMVLCSKMTDEMMAEIKRLKNE